MSVRSNPAVWLVTAGPEPNSLRTGGESTAWTPVKYYGFWPVEDANFMVCTKRLKACRGNELFSLVFHVT